MTAEGAVNQFIVTDLAFVLTCFSLQGFPDLIPETGRHAEFRVFPTTDTPVPTNELILSPS